MVPNNSTKFEIRSQVISGNHWGGQRDRRTRTHQAKRRVPYNTSPLTKPSAELEIKVDVKYVSEDERTGPVKGESWHGLGKWERGKDFGKWVTCGKY